MRFKVKCVVIDRDKQSNQFIQDCFHNSPHVEITASYTNSNKFLSESKKVDFDMMLVDIYSPTINGLRLANIFPNRRYIFLTHAEKNIKRASQLAPIDIIFKPLKKERLKLAMERAHLLFTPKASKTRREKEYQLFNVAEAVTTGKMMLYIPDIQYVTCDDVDRRHKAAFMRDGKQFTLMNYTMEELQGISPGLIQVNRSSLVAKHVIKHVAHDLVTLNVPNERGKDMQITLSRQYKGNLRFL